MMIDGNFKIATDQRLSHSRRDNGRTSSSGILPHRVEIIYPPQTDFEHLQPWLFKVVTEALRKPRPYYRHGFRNWLPVTDSVTPGSASILPYTLGKLLQQRTYQPVAIPDDSPPPVIRLRTAPRALPHPRDEPRSPLLDFNG